MTARWMATGIAAATMLALGAGCAQTTYSVLDDLPDPPAARAAVAATPPLRPQIPVLTVQPERPERPVRPAPVPNVPAGWLPPTREQRWRYIVIHHSATDRGSAASFDKMHREVRGWDELGYHFVITNGNGGSDGKIEVGSRWTKQKWGAHCGGTPNNEYNNYGIGICLVGNFEAHNPSARQLASLKRLARFLAHRYKIPASAIIGHRDAPCASTACPGACLHRLLATGLREQLAQ